MIQTINNTIGLIKTKALLALFPAGIFIITDVHREILAIVLWLLIIDTVLGVMVAIKTKRFCSYKLVKAIHKFIIYMLALSTAYLVSSLDLPLLHYFYFYVGSFIAITEAVSNFEKMALLGLKVPKQILSKLNIDFKDNNIEKILSKK